MSDKDDMDVFPDAINNLPDDLISAKFDGHKQQKSIPKKPGSGAAFDKKVDLHGFTEVEAMTVLRNVLSSSKGKGHKILLITGKGKNSEGGYGIIRDAVVGYLEREGTLYIREFRFASPKNGGDGAIEIITK